MSGHDKDSGGGSYEPIHNCGNISFTTDINSPQKEAIIGLEVGDQLSIILQTNVIVVVRQDNGEIVGSINWSSITRLIECIRDGHEYIAIIRYIQDGLIKVHITAK